MIIERYRGDTYRIRVQIFDRMTRLPIDLSAIDGAYLTIDSLEAPPDNKTQVDQLVGTVVDGPNGVVEFYPNADKPADPGNYWYDISIVDTALKEHTVALDEYRVTQDINKIA